MRKGMIASCVLGLLLTAAPATFAASCPDDGIQQWSQEWNQDEPWVLSSKGSYLGVEVTDVTPERLSALKLKEESGVEVTAVDQDAPAGKAGFKEHDVILTINGQKIEGEEQLRRVVRETPAGRTISIGISRDGQPMTLKATLASRKEQMNVFMKMPKPPKAPKAPGMTPMPPMPPEAFHYEFSDVPEVRVYSRSPRIGIMVEDLTPQLADFFGVKNGNGLLIRSVEKGSIADTAGLKAGDVIVSVEKERVNDLSDWRRLVRNKSGNVGIGIVRDKRDQTLTVKLPEREQGSMFNDSDFDVDIDLSAIKQQLDKELPKIQEQQKLAMLKAQKEIAAHRGDYEKAMAEA